MFIGLGDFWDLLSCYQYYYFNRIAFTNIKASWHNIFLNLQFIEDISKITYRYFNGKLLDYQPTMLYYGFFFFLIIIISLFLLFESLTQCPHVCIILWLMDSKNFDESFQYSF